MTSTIWTLHRSEGGAVVGVILSFIHHAKGGDRNISSVNESLIVHYISAWKIIKTTIMILISVLYGTCQDG